jgi:Mn2+/Fe2+ NRAMP family transporter
MKKLSKGQWVFVAFLAIATLWSIIAELTGHHEGHHWWSGIPLFWIWFGLGGCLLLIVFAKNLLAPFIYKKEDYYNE